MCDISFPYRLCLWIQYLLSDTLISKSRNCRFVGILSIGYQWWGKRGVKCDGVLGECCLVVPVCRGFAVGAVRVAAVWGVLGEDRWPSTSEF